jgi:predicted NAD/FAD-dependent oxidoreductase
MKSKKIKKPLNIYATNFRFAADDNSLKHLSKLTNFLSDNEWLKISNDKFHDFTIDKQIYDNMFVPENGMNSLVSSFIKNNNINSNIKITKIIKENDYFLIKDDLDNSYYAEKCIITCPLAQSLEIIHDLPFFKEWESLTQKYLNYKILQYLFII